MSTRAKLAASSAAAVARQRIFAQPDNHPTSAWRSSPPARPVQQQQQPKGEHMFRRRKALLSVLAAIAVVASLAVAPAATASGPTIGQLTNAGWTCMSSPVVPRIVCSSPGLGFPSVPADPDGPPAFSHTIFSLDETFLGTTHLIRADLYRGQPCGPDGAYIFIGLIGYYRCDHF
jgi:hypothetical protein